MGCARGKGRLHLHQTPPNVHAELGPLRWVGPAGLAGPDKWDRLHSDATHGGSKKGRQRQCRQPCQENASSHFRNLRIVGSRPAKASHVHTAIVGREIRRPLERICRAAQQWTRQASRALAGVIVDAAAGAFACDELPGRTLELLHHTQLPHARECHPSTGTAVTHQPTMRHPSAEAPTRGISRSNTATGSPEWESNPRPTHYEGDQGRPRDVGLCRLAGAFGSCRPSRGAS